MPAWKPGDNAPGGVTWITVPAWGRSYLARAHRGRLEPMAHAGLVSTAARRLAILVVEDEDIVRALVTRALREAGYRVVQAQHGAAAIALLDAQGGTIDLVISDLVLPGLGGREIAHWVAAHLPHLPVLFISGYPKAYLEAHGLFDQTVPLLRKPFLPSRLLETVQELLQDDRGHDSLSAAEGH